MEATIHDDYPGVEFTPPPGTVGMHDTEGEEMVKWKMIGDRYMILSFGGQALERGQQPDEQVVSERPSPDEEESVGSELRRLASY